MKGPYNMCNNLSIEQIRQKISFKYSQRTILQESKTKRTQNINTFLNISRNGLEYQRREKRILLYSTLENESIFMQFPGKESTKNPPKPYDFRPELITSSGEQSNNMSFVELIDIIIDLNDHNNALSPIIAAIFLNISYMHHYKRESNNYSTSVIDFSDNTITSIEDTELDWFLLDYDDTLWRSLNNYAGTITLSNGLNISFEALIKYIDVLFQNEDCKYNFKGHQDGTYELTSGRNNSCNSYLRLLYYLEGHHSLASFIGSFMNGRGVSNFTKSKYDMVTNGIVINVDNN